MNSNEMIDVDLPSLQSIQLGECALQGRLYNVTTTLIMRSNNDMIGYDLICRSSKSNINNFCGRQFLLSSCSDIGKYFCILNIDSI